VVKKPSREATYRLCLMRHGPAGQRGSLGPEADDGLRPLTPEGREKVERAALGLRKLVGRVDWIVTSPLVRARETAEMVAELFPGIPLNDCAALAPGGSAEEVVAFLGRKSARTQVLLVGHEPSLGHMAGRLLGLGARANLSLKKGGSCLIEFTEFPPEGPGELMWWVTPRILRRLG